MVCELQEYVVKIMEKLQVNLIITFIDKNYNVTVLCCLLSKWQAIVTYQL